MIDDIDPRLWFCERELQYPPRHFVQATTKATEESKQWVLEKLRGRFAVTQNNDNFFENITYLGTISFEDPSEAMMFELKWS